MPKHAAFSRISLHPWLEFDDRGGDVCAGGGVDGERDGGRGGRTEAVVREGCVRAGVSGGHAHDLRRKEEGDIVISFLWTF